MAASSAENHQDQLTELILWGSYPSKTVDLSTSTLKILSIFGSLDGLSSLGEIESSKRQLQVDPVFYQIDGGNHVQFYSYGWQRGDQPAIIISVTTEFIHSVPQVKNPDSFRQKNRSQLAPVHLV